jgi:hypothetical protein
MPYGVKMKFKIPTGSWAGRTRHTNIADQPPTIGKVVAGTVFNHDQSTEAQIPPRQHRMNGRLPRTAWASGRRYSETADPTQSVGMEVADSAVIHVLDCAALIHQSTDAPSPSQNRSTHVVYTDDSSDGDESPWHCNSLQNHGFYQKSNIKTAGIALAKPHNHVQGLTQVIFDNCLIQVRPGKDLDQLLAKSIDGPVHLIGVQTNGWIESNAKLLPAFIYHRWLTSMPTI